MDSPTAAAEFIERTSRRYRSEDSEWAEHNAIDKSCYVTMRDAGFDHTEPFMRQQLFRLLVPRISGLEHRLKIKVEKSRYLLMACGQEQWSHQ